MSLRNRLAAIFSPTRRLAGPEPATVRGGGPLGGVQWVVPRAECHYRRMDLSGLPARQRAAAARIAARRHEPRPQASFHVAWTGGIAHVWTWTAFAGDGTPGEAEWIPESLLRASPRDGAFLCRVKRALAPEGLLARFSHAAQSELLCAVEETRQGPRLRSGGALHALPSI